VTIILANHNFPQIAHRPMQVFSQRNSD